MPITKIPLAICGYRLGRRAYVPYSGNLTEAKYLKIKKILDREGFSFGWRCRDIEIFEDDAGLVRYKEDGAGGAVEEIKVFHIED